MKKTHWTLSELPAPNQREDDRFDRKGFGSDENELRKYLAKALSAFANSGGGHVFIGIADDGTMDGVPEIYKGRQSSRDWLENIAGNLLDPPLQDVRVHAIPLPPREGDAEQKVVLVIDVGDSDLAPHQAAKSGVYYYRVSNQSLPAPDFYVRLLSTRRLRPRLQVSPTTARVVGLVGREHGSQLLLSLDTRIVNVGEFAARHVTIRFEHDGQGSPNIVTEYSALSQETDAITWDAMGAEILLPGGSCVISKPIGVNISKSLQSLASLAETEVITCHLSGDLSVRHLSETHISDVSKLRLEDIISSDLVSAHVKWMLPTFIVPGTGEAGWGISFSNLVVKGGQVSAILQNRSKNTYRSVRLHLWVVGSEWGEFRSYPLIATARLNAGNTAQYTSYLDGAVLPQAGRHMLVVVAADPSPMLIAKSRD